MAEKEGIKQHRRYTQESKQLLRDTYKGTHPKQAKKVKKAKKRLKDGNQYKDTGIGTKDKSGVEEAIRRRVGIVQAGSKSKVRGQGQGLQQPQAIYSLYRQREATPAL
ncbi:hypothetical protein [Anaerorudis cellulosivorans]|uniref:hypothetical protein n=1 Tax=Anaerorudis cellulosivorans TaxID=3397862 RepID=UPI002220DA84|nr:hypothetical protein [Seramator thermalis]MCW1734759.1 hypothetical protein [Seramator thermalis]